VATNEMYRTFNCGVGMVLCVSQADVGKAKAVLQDAGHDTWEIGRITAGANTVELLS